MHAAIEKAIGPLRQRIMMMIGRAVLAAVNDGATMQSVQVQVLAGETGDDVERFQNVWFTGVPFTGAEAIVASVMGSRSHLVAVAVDDRRHRIKGQAPGESAHHDDQGQMFQIKRDGLYITTGLKVVINAGAEVDVTAPKVLVTSPDVQLGGDGGKKVALDGDPVVGGKVQASAAKVFAQ